MKCPVPFIIWFHHRSGSTHLASLLDSHAAITCWKELFYRGEGTAVEDPFTRSRAPGTDCFLEQIFSYRWGPGGANLSEADPRGPLPRAVGFKLKYEQAAVYPRVLEYLREQPNIRVLHLVRRNLLATLVSATRIPLLFERFRRPNLLVGEALGAGERSVRLEPRTILDELEVLEAKIQQARRHVAAFQTLEIAYEDLLDVQAATCRKILEFLEVDPAAELTSRYVKVLPRTVTETLVNASEIRAALRGSRFAPLLECA